MKRARATIAARNPRVPTRMHVGPVAPVAVGCGQLQADDVLEHVRRRVDLDVHRPPERDSHSGAVRLVGAPARHDALPDGGRLARPWRLHNRPSGLPTVISRVPWVFMSR